MAEWIIRNNSYSYSNFLGILEELDGILYWGWDEKTHKALQKTIDEISKGDIVYIYKRWPDRIGWKSDFSYKCEVISPKLILSELTLPEEQKEYLQNEDKKSSITGPYIELKILEMYYESEVGMSNLWDTGLLQKINTDLGKCIKERTSQVANIYKRFVDKNMILYGPPGTGKTYNSAIYAVAIGKKWPLEYVKKMSYEEVTRYYKQLQENERVQFTTFHQSYGYEEFIEGIRPVIDENDDKADDKSDNKGDIRYTIEAGVFKKFCDRAREDLNRNYVFIIDEINRGNISKIFGELITLIEDTKREKMDEEVFAVLPYSGDEFSVPKNVYILGTMNTADRSIALMDVALRRRFRFIEMMPDPEVLDGIIVKGEEEQEVNVTKLLETINARIEILYDREHTIGHAFFTLLQENPTVEKLGKIFKNSVIPLLQEYFYEDYEKIQLVLGDDEKTESKYKFIKDESVNPEEVFNGWTGNEFDLPEKIYTINEEAFGEIQSYIQIYE